MKVGEQLLYLAQLKGLNKSEAMDKLKYWFEKFDIKTWWDKSVEDLSKGMQQKIQFVATVLHQPKLIILDEPFSGFDPINANIIKDEILELRDKGSSIIFSTHRMDSVEELCDHIALINKSKKVLEGKKLDIKEQFRSDSFTVNYSGTLPETNSAFDIIKSETLLDGSIQSVVKSKIESGSSKEVLAELIEKIDIKSFTEDVASMNDVFIKAVKQSN